MARPNILYLHSHDTGRYVSPYGHAMPTPNIQRLAEGGVLFRQAFCAAPTCSPSRAALLTGRCAHASGMLGLAHRGFALADYSQHLVRTLQGAGYRTALSGVQHEAADARILGYDQLLAPAGRDAEHVAAAAVDWLTAAPATPWFLSVGFFETHREFPAPDPATTRYAPRPDGLPDVPAIRADMAAYQASVRRLDAGMGRVLQALERQALAENTLVICTTDHGIAFPGAKCTLSDRGIGVMLILRGPGGWVGGRACDALVSQVDLYPTICELLGIAPTPWLEGHSLQPLAYGEAEAVRDAIYAEVTYHAAYEPLRAVRTARWKYIRRYGERRLPVLPNCDDGPSKSWLLAHGWAERALPVEALYDLAWDPHEAHNLADDPALAGVGNAMRARLERWMTETDDPLLQGEPVPAPVGSRVNDPAGLSPREEPREVR